MLSESTFLEGQFLVTMPNMVDERFESTIIFVCAHNDEGAMGFIVNRPMQTPSVSDFLKKLGLVTERDLDKIPADVSQRELHIGGPVEPGRGFVLHSPDYRSVTTLRVNEEVSLTATLEILRDIAVGKGPENYFLALGYSGWGAGQLEEEIAANGWLTCSHNSWIIYDRDHETKYMRVMKSMGIDPRLISGETGHA